MCQFLSVYHAIGFFEEYVKNIFCSIICDHGSIYDGILCGSVSYYFIEFVSLAPATASPIDFCLSNSSMPAPILLDVGVLPVKCIRKLYTVEAHTGIERAKEKWVLCWHTEYPL